MPSVPRLARVFTPMLVSFRVNSELQPFRRRLSSRKIEFRCDCSIVDSFPFPLGGILMVHIGIFPDVGDIDSILPSFLSLFFLIEKTFFFFKIENSTNPFLNFFSSVRV